jgi:acetoin utilization protein AcuB
MIVKNWMLPQQHSISSDALAIEAVMLIREHNLKMLPVVDEGRLRGILHRRDLSEAAYCVSGSGDVCEVNYFSSKLKVKDLMIRSPVTVSMHDSVEDTLVKGRELTMSTFPVMDEDEVVGVVSDREIFITLFKLLEADRKRTRITLTDVTVDRGVLSDIAKTLDETGAIVRGIFSVPEGKSEKARVVIRAEADDPDELRTALENRGFKILEFA